jgi:RNA polymerase sigma-70 factor (ECF subfamily)
MWARRIFDFLEPSVIDAGTFLKDGFSAAPLILGVDREIPPERNARSALVITLGGSSESELPRCIAVQRARSGRALNMGERIRLIPEGRALVRDDVDEAQLLRRLVERHPRALRASWLRFAPLVFRLLKRALGPDEDVRELAQQVFLRLFRHVADLRDPSELRPLMIALTTRTLRAELRMRRVRRWLRIRRAPQAPRSSSIPPEPTSRAAVRRLYAILDRCGTDERIAFAFHFLDGLSLEDVAGALNLSLSATQEVLARVWSRNVLFVEHDGALLDYLYGVEGQGACA